MFTTTGALIAAGVAAALGAGGSAINRSKAKKEENRYYQRASDMLSSQYWRDPLKTYGAGTLLKAARQSHADDLDALNNRMVAGGATMENQLAARQASNEGMDKLYGQLLQGEDARRDSIDAQRMRLEQQHSAALQGGFMQAAQDWSQWGAQTAGAFMSLGSTGLLGDGAGAAAGAGRYAADMDKYRGVIDALQKVEPESQGFQYAELAPAKQDKPLGGLTMTL